MKNQILNIVLPVLNEQACLKDNVEQVCAFLESHKIPYLITIADNGSTDDTPAIARSLCDQNKYIEYVRIEQKGVGRALSECIAKNSSRHEPCEFTGYMDIDLSTNLEHLQEVYTQLLNNKNIVVGSRLLKHSRVYNRSLKREISSRGLNILLKVFLNTKFSDAMCGFKFYQHAYAENISTKCYKDDGWFYCAQMLIVAQYMGIPIYEIPVIWHDDKNSKVKILRLSLTYLKHILTLWLKKIKGQL